MAAIESSTTSSSSSRPTYSCIRCADRKVKCDRQRPCGACVKHNVECFFHPPQPPRKRPRRVRYQILTDRLRYYETLLQEQGIDSSRLHDIPNSGAAHISSNTNQDVSGEALSNMPSRSESDQSQSINKIQVVHGPGRLKFVENLWNRVVEEFQSPEEALEDSSNDASDLETSDDEFGYVLSNEAKSNSRPRHPVPERINQLWQIFVDNVDPLTKIVHVPTLRPAIQKSLQNVGSMPKSFEALMFAIYSAAVMSLKDGECLERLGEHRKTLLSRYVSATKAALSRAKFMGTIDLVVLQALVLHLVSTRDIYEPRAVWSLTGVAIRIAQSMGLDRDGISLGLSPFETEMRRRIWWLLKTHDFRTAELCGLAKFRDLDTSPDGPKAPTNINDDQLHPGMSSLVSISTGLTDAAFIALRSEISHFATGRIARYRRQGKDPTQWNLYASGSDKVDIDEAFKEVEEAVETKYVRYCDPSQPLHLMVMMLARFSMNIIRFLTHHPRRWVNLEHTPLSERQWVWDISIKLLEQYNMILSNPMLKQFSWHAPYFKQWHVFIHVLDTLRATPLIPNAEKAWQLIGNVYENIHSMTLDTKKPIHVAVGVLCLRAYSTRETALQNEHMNVPPLPKFISKLRHQHETIKAKRQARHAKSKQAEELLNQGQNNAGDPNPRQQASTLYGNENLKPNLLPQTKEPPAATSTTTPSTAQIHPQPNTAAQPDDPFWFINGFNDSQFSSSDGLMTSDSDFMLSLDSSTDGNATPMVTWEQWDAWLADSNVLRPESTPQEMRTAM